MPEKNALAELAEKLSVDADVVSAYKDDLGEGEGTIGQLMQDDIRKASRIVAELAKVGFYNNIYGDLFARSEEARDALVRCYKIAEEGTGDA